MLYRRVTRALRRQTGTLLRVLTSAQTRAVPGTGRCAYKLLPTWSREKLVRREREGKTRRVEPGSKKVLRRT